MSNEELIFRILEDERERRIKMVVEIRRIEAEDAAIIAVLGLNEEIGEIRSEIGILRSKVDELSERMATKDDIRTTQWVTVICFAVLTVIVALLSLGL